MASSSPPVMRSCLWTGFTATEQSYFFSVGEARTDWTIWLLLRSQKESSPLSPTIAASPDQTIFTSYTSLPKFTSWTRDSAFCQQQALPVKSPLTIPSCDHSKANPLLRLPSISKTGYSFPCLKMQTGPQSVLAAMSEPSPGECLALLISASWVNLKSAFNFDACRSLGSSCRSLRAGKATSAIYKCSDCAPPEECVAYRQRQVVWVGVSSRCGSHWKVSEGHLSFWMRRRSQRKPAFYIQMACWSGQGCGSDCMAPIYTNSNISGLLVRRAENKRYEVYLGKSCWGLFVYLSVIPSRRLLPQMKLTLPQRPKRPQSEQLMDLFCRTHLSWINPHTHDTKYLLNQLCNRHQLQRNLQVGSVCAHVSRHYSAHRMRRQYADLFFVEKIVEKYQLVFNNKQGKGEGKRNPTQGTGLSTIEKLIFYGKVCLLLTMKPQFKQSITNLKQFEQRLISIVRKLLSSLLLQFIPAEYSQLVLKLYLQDAQTEQEREWMQENRTKHEDVYPFHDFFQILSSLSYHILNTRKVINWQHYLEILGNPSVGCVEWPMVIGVRNLHRLPYPKS